MGTGLYPLRTHHSEEGIRRPSKEGRGRGSKEGGGGGGGGVVSKERGEG